ncbi:asparagine synthetase B family protein [Spartinivicinus ruber]|uniref:hypothetical protein n=1 Tax=Spartinivicinus ruber TaxID=2683272 RepID=UPI0013D77001|nr:hypothetical protein [Spartinivicinus ruber]
MGAFALIKESAFSFIEPVSQSLQQQGFQRPIQLTRPGFQLFICPKQVNPISNYYENSHGDFCVSVGTLMYQGLHGEPALRSLLDDFNQRPIPHNRFYGTYCILIYKAGRLFCFTDSLGLYKVYHNEEQTILSSSFLALITATSKPVINKQCVYEYIFQGATYGTDTVINQIATLEPHWLYKLIPNNKTYYRACHPQFKAAYGPLEILVEDNVASLREQFAAINHCFGNKIDTALSGGYDSRLMLAMLREQGTTPRLHVYGKSTDPDVLVAKTICESEHIPLQQVDKQQQLPLSPDALAQQVNQTFYRFDGYPIDGVWDNGQDLATRQQRSEGGRLPLNGGGGEIYRNFFYLPDKSYTVQQFLWSFYSQFDPAMCTQAFQQQFYHRNLADKVKTTLNQARNRLNRTSIEYLYPAFRCRFWAGRNNSLNNRFGLALTPFMEMNSVTTAVNVPIKWKNHGILEARMILNVDPILAGYQSDYGHHFAAVPPLKHKLKDWLTYIRPPKLRQMTYRIKHRRQTLQRPYYLTADYLRQLINIEFPYLSQYVHVDKIKDNEQFNRVCTLELLFQRYNVSSN